MGGRQAAAAAEAPVGAITFFFNLFATVALSIVYRVLCIMFTSDGSPGWLKVVGGNTLVGSPGWCSA